ncbi:phosphoketolase family protein, partial [Candidatus Saccharibacteria bacterium]|nr:phosphoketolase family protein [Candidatus Saccharibacteria bacterium]
MKKRGQFSSKKSIEAWVHAADYLSVAQCFLHKNATLERKLEFGDVKKRLVGHFGTCHGINVTYAYLTAWIKYISELGERPNMLFVLGPGHGLQALNACHFLEGSLTDLYGEKVDKKGVNWLCKNFSWPSGFPSHASPMSPGTICEGGELGYCLGIAFGAALDNPDLIVPCLIGDGEAETASLLASLHLPRIINAKDNGMVLPILHLNDYKIGGPTIYGRMSNDELLALFYGFGWNPIIIDERNASFYKDFSAVLKEVWQSFQSIKKGKNVRLPFIIYRSRKGEGGPETFRGNKIAGNNLAHQVILNNAGKDPEELLLLQKWLKSYHFERVFNENGLSETAAEILPKKELRMGRNRLAYGGFERFLIENRTRALKTSDDKEVDYTQHGDFLVSAARKQELDSSAMRVGEVLRELLVQNKDYRVFCPDETDSNKLSAVYEATGRAWQLPIKAWDKGMDRNGRLVEVLSENTLFSLLAGYTLTGRRGVMASYEAFMSIVDSQTTQYVKFLLQKKGLAWWGRVPALNVLLTSVGWRQDHNGFSHQNPGYISERLLRPTGCENVFFPLGAAAAAEAMRFSANESFDSVNTIVAGKQMEP